MGENVGTSDARDINRKKSSKAKRRKNKTSEESETKESATKESAYEDAAPSKEPDCAVHQKASRPRHVLADSSQKPAYEGTTPSKESDCAIYQRASRPRHLLADSPQQGLPPRRSITFKEEEPLSSFFFYHSKSTALVPFIAAAPSGKRNAAIFSDIWAALSSIFCFTSDNHMPDDDYVMFTGSMDEDDLPSSRSRKNKSLKKKSKSFIAESLNVFDWTAAASPPKPTPSNPLLFSRVGDYTNDKVLLGLDLLEEGQRILKIFAGITRVKGVMFNWALRASKKDVNVHTCDIQDSPWQAIKSDCIIHQTKHNILKLYTDDTRSYEYDESMEGYEDLGTLGEDVRVRRYYYKAMWPTSARDFVLCSGWKELQDGSILVSTISPPEAMFPPSGSYLRAHINISGVLIRPIDSKLGGGCAVTMIGHSDLKGSLPSTIVNMLSVGLPMKMMAKIKSILEKE